MGKSGLPRTPYVTLIAKPWTRDTLNVTAKFEPVLKAYISLDYRQTEMLRAEIETIDPIWERNLLSLGQSTTIIIKRTPQGGFVASDGLRAGSAGFDSDAFPMFKDIDASLFYSKVSLSRMPSRDA